jgi:hypothetical protein
MPKRVQFADDLRTDKPGSADYHDLHGTCPFPATTPNASVALGIAGRPGGLQT